MPDRCTHLKEFNPAQIAIIRRHIDEHKWFAQIADEEDGKSDFIEKFGWAMREVFCFYLCSERAGCITAYRIFNRWPDQTPVNKDILEIALEEISRRHLDEHKWFHHITDPEVAINDFIAKFGWIVQELICGFFCEQRYECPAAKSFQEENKNLEPET